MARMHVMEQSETQAIMSSMHEMLEKRLSVSSLAPCPVEFTASYVAMCATQSCGKCTPCRNGLRMLRHLFNDVLNNRATLETLDLIESTARTSSSPPPARCTCRATARSATRPARWPSWPSAASATTSSTT